MAYLVSDLQSQCLAKVKEKHAQQLRLSNERHIRLKAEIKSATLITALKGNI
jgi:hypothetical protein